MVGILEILLSIFCISIIIYVVKNFNVVKQKIDDNPILLGFFIGFVLIIVIVMLSFSFVYVLYTLDNFEIIDIENYISENEIKLME